MQGVSRSPVRRSLVLTFVVTAFAAVLAFGQASQTEPLFRAVRDGKVIATFRGTGGSSGDAVEVDVTKTPRAGPGPLHLTIPPGSMLRSANGAEQSMVIMGVEGRSTGPRTFAPATSITITSTKPVTYILLAFCAEFEKENPSTTDTFTLYEPVPMLACLAKEGKTLSIAAQQAAVWQYTDHLTYAQANEKFPVGQADWVAAERVFQDCAGSGFSPSGSGSSVASISAAGMPTVEGDMGVHTRVATSASELAALRASGDQIYTEFELISGAPPLEIGDVKLLLVDAIPALGRFSIQILAPNGRTLVKKDRHLNEALQFMLVGEKKQSPYEIVINAFTSKGVVGYLSQPNPENKARTLHTP